METKTFLILWGAVFTVAILSGFLVVSSYLSTQQFQQFKESQIQSDKRFNESQAIHNNQTNNITSEVIYLGDRLYPILDQIPNATQSKIDQDRHYNQSKELNDILHAMGNNSEIVEQNKQEHALLIDINRTLSELIHKQGTTADNDTQIQPIINNVTEFNKTGVDDRGLIN